MHPGESNSSYMMEGFIEFITGNNPAAVELRKRIVFHIIPCINPDGVIAGNYRVCMSGNDLNRRYIQPHPQLHPIVCAIKKLIKKISLESRYQELNSLYQKENIKTNFFLDENKSVLAFIDMHGHS